MQGHSTLPVLIIWEEGTFVAKVKAPGFLFTTAGDSVPTILDNLQNLIADYLTHEGATAPHWQGITISAIAFECTYDLKSFFEHYKELKIAAIANRAGINANLLQQYVSGNKRASENQVKKIEQAIQQLALELRSTALT